MSLSMKCLEAGLLPDVLVRAGIRHRLSRLLDSQRREAAAKKGEAFEDFVRQIRLSPISIHTDAANRQHYELPAEFFYLILGSRMKYSCGYWPQNVTGLDASEEAMLALTVERAQIMNGHHILELGCGWGSLSLYMAERFPGSAITAVSNSASQRVFIERRAAERGIRNLRIVTEEMSRLELSETYDRVISVEMFEHMRNYEKLFEKISRWIRPSGELFFHVFGHREFPFFYDESDPEDWMARYFFTGGTMPSRELFSRFQDHFEIRDIWDVSGTHYQKTCLEWLRRMDKNRGAIEPILQSVYGADFRKWRIYWRVFFMACEELFGYAKGAEWGVFHYRLKCR